MINIEPVKTAFLNITNAIDKHEYIRAVEFASIAINEIRNSLLFTALEHRAFALSQIGKLDVAINDAQEMIKLIPTSPKGYDRLGNLYSIQGKQQNVIDTYERALENILPNDQARIQLQQQQNIARKKYKKRIDFMTKLPPELADDILSELPQESKAICLHVSSNWRKCLLNCPKAWSSLKMDDDNLEDTVEITNILSYIAPHVKSLTIDTPKEAVWSQYLLHLTNGCFKNQVLKHITPDKIMSMTNAFWRMQFTLTHIKLYVLEESQPVLPIMDLLSICTNLITLEYFTTSPFSDIIGDSIMTLSGMHSHPLRCLNIESFDITKELIVPLLERCQELRVLCLDGCANDVLAYIGNKCPDLKWLSFNHEHEFDIKEVLCRNNNDEKLGLREMHAADAYGRYLHPIDALPIIEKYKQTLKILDISFDPNNDEDDDEQPPVITVAMNQTNWVQRHKYLKLENLQQLIFYVIEGDEDVSSIILNSVKGSTSLTKVTIIGSYDMVPIANTLSSLSSLETLRLGNQQNHSSIEEEDSIYQLFNKLSIGGRENANSTRLKKIQLDGCNCVTDHVLSAIGNVSTILDISLYSLQEITPTGIKNYFQKLDKVTKLDLHDMDIITNGILTVIGNNMTSLQNLILSELKHVTGDGIMNLIYKPTHNTLKYLEITSCPFVTEVVMIEYAGKINDVRIHVTPPAQDVF
ncbi:hypothetical protein INT45_008223 [Circinella minor]|uniref:F-box domain-containing protein n=1 Tax=Circinella minor TaxID=1195481 RepID=A0A8H7S1V4_9FUNG|nr:hypothetical protein INT45_008223 [Circinella minor]